ncbi:AP endonuclease [Gyrodon lividus]|nr:AP endonuclease [Gyrodon lividus]
MAQTRRTTTRRAAAQSEHEQNLETLAVDVNLPLPPPPHEGDETRIRRPAKRAKKAHLPDESKPPVAVDAGADTNEDTGTAVARDKPSKRQRQRRRNLKAGTKTDRSAPKPSDFAPRVSSPWKIGAHVSAKGGVENTIVNAARVGANAFALFVKSQRKWSSPPLTDENIASFKARMDEFGYDPKYVLPHGSYLINLGNPDEGKREKSYGCFLDDLKRCEQLGLTLYNFHPGSTVGKATKEESIALIAQCLNKAHKETSFIVTVIENMAGAGNIIGSQFADLRDIINLVEDKSRIGVCLDTCEPRWMVYAAVGFDVELSDRRRSFVRSLATFDEHVGLSYLRGMHLNDSKTPLGSRKDRHENIGLGTLTLPTFLTLLTDPRIQNIPLILETPTFEAVEVWEAEIGVLNRLAELGMGVGGGRSGEEDTGMEEKLKGMVNEIRSIVRDHRDTKGKGGKATTRGKSERKSKKRKKAGGGQEEQDGEGDTDDSDPCAEDSD